MSWQEASGQPLWLLDLQVAGAIHRYAEQAITIDGDRYVAGLSAVTLGEAAVSGQQVPIEVVAQTDWAAVEAEGHSLERTPATLKRYRAGTVETWVAGLAMGCSYAEVGQPLTFNLSREAIVSESQALDPRWVIDETTHPTGGANLPDSSNGQRYNWIIGCPGHDPDASQPRPAVPIWLVSEAGGSPPSVLDRMLIAAGEIQASNVQVWNMTTNSTEQRPVVTTTEDKLGQRYSSHDWNPNSIYTDSANDYAIGLQDDATYGGGYPNPYRPGRPLRGAGDIVRWVTSQIPGLEVDRGRLDSFAPWLNRFQVDTYISEQIGWDEWLESAVLSWLPVQAVNGPEGLYYAPVRWDLTAADVVAYLDADRRQVQRVGALQRLGQDVYNEITINYRPRLGGGFYAQRTLTAVDGQLQRATTFADDPRIRGSFLAKRSQTIYGARPLSVDLLHTWDDATADEVAVQLMYRHAWHKRIVSYQGGPELEALSVGDCIAVTESAVSLDQALARVLDIRPERQTCTVDLVLLDNPTEATA